VKTFSISFSNICFNFTGGGQLIVIVHEAQDVEGKYHTNPQAFSGEDKKTKVQHPMKFYHSIFHFSSFRIKKITDSPTFP
jgi:hypothetical protein